jgi:hypothetical protein
MSNPLPPSVFASKDLGNIKVKNLILNSQIFSQPYFSKNVELEIDYKGWDRFFLLCFILVD